MYTAVVISKEDRVGLLEAMRDFIPPWWETVAHHMTINMKSAAEGPCSDRLGEEVELTVTSYAMDDKVLAVGVDTDVPSTNAIKHITVAVNRIEGGKPMHSNQLKEWKPIPELRLRGVISEV